MTRPNTSDAPLCCNELASEALPRSVEGRHPFDVEKGCIQISPFITVQGEIISGWGDMLSIKCNGKIYQGRAVK